MGKLVNIQISTHRYRHVSFSQSNYGKFKNQDSAIRPIHNHTLLVVFMNQLHEPPQFAIAKVR